MSKIDFEYNWCSKKELKIKQRFVFWYKSLFIFYKIESKVIYSKSTSLEFSE